MIVTVDKPLSIEDRIEMIDASGIGKFHTELVGVCAAIESTTIRCCCRFIGMLSAAISQRQSIPDLTANRCET
jgi:hypothetical protein